MSKAALSNLIENCEITAQLLKAMAHPQRLVILCHLTKGEKSVSELVALSGSSQSVVSQFLGRMKAEKLVACRKAGNFVYYTVSDRRIFRVIKSLQQLFDKAN